MRAAPAAAGPRLRPLGTAHATPATGAEGTRLLFVPHGAARYTAYPPSARALRGNPSLLAEEFDSDGAFHITAS